MDRQEAEQLYDSGREAVVATLLKMQERIRELEQDITRLTRNSTNSSRPSSSDPPSMKKSKTAASPGLRLTPDHSHKVTRAKHTLKNWQHLFIFLKYESVEPTNNIAERAIRPSVQWRKLCFGSQSDTGERFAERMMSIVGTCRLHQVNPYHFLTKVIRASFSGKGALLFLSRLLSQ